MYESNTAATQEQVVPGFLRSRALRPALITTLVFYFIYLIVVMAPAQLAAWAVHSSIPNFWLTGVSGSLWNGSARGSQIDVNNQSIALGGVSWSLNPLSLLTLEPCVTFKADEAVPVVSGTLCQSLLGASSLKDVSVDFPVDMLSDFVPVQATGYFSLQVIEADIDGNRVESLDARFSWQDASVFNGESWWRFGTFGGDARAKGDGSIAVHVEDISGPVGVDLNAGFVLGSEMWTADGTVSPSSEAPPEISQALQVIGEEVEPGKYKVAWP